MINWEGIMENSKYELAKKCYLKFFRRRDFTDDKDDYIQEGIIGIIEAERKFDREKGEFESYCFQHAYYSMQKFFRWKLGMKSTSKIIMKESSLNDEELRIEYLLPSKVSEYEICCNIDLKDFIRKQKRPNNLRLKLNGYTNNEISKITKTPLRTVNRDVKNLKDFIHEG